MRIAAIAMVVTLVAPVSGALVYAQEAGKSAETVPVPAPSDVPSAARIDPIVPPVKRVVPKQSEKEDASAAKKGAKEPAPKKAAAGKNEKAKSAPSKPAPAAKK